MHFVDNTRNIRIACHMSFCIVCIRTFESLRKARDRNEYDTCTFKPWGGERSRCLFSKIILR